MELDLPYPPSVNHLWRRVGRRTVLSRAARAYRTAVKAAFLAHLLDHGVRRYTCRLSVFIDVHPPDKRRRDIDNVIKAALDALAYGGAYADDSQVEDLHIRKRECVPKGKLRVRIVPLTDPGDATGAASTAPVAVAKPRTCLRCGLLFPSEGPGNRICASCRAINERQRISRVEELSSTKKGDDR